MNQGEKISILLVEDNPNFGDVLRSYLQMLDFKVDLAVDGKDGYNKFKNGNYDLGVLDVMMPKMDGFTLAESIRKDNNDFPIIFLTARNLKDDIVKGFKLGADDYLTKPFNSEELLMRIKAVLKRSGKGAQEKEKNNEFSFGKFYFNYPLRELTFMPDTEKENTSRLSPKESELLRLFCINLNEILERSEALIKIWNEDSYFTARSMDVFITKLRKYLKPDENLEIVNIHGNGFRLMVKDEVEQ